MFNRGDVENVTVESLKRAREGYCLCQEDTAPAQRSWVPIRLFSQAVFFATLRDKLLEGGPGAALEYAHLSHQALPKASTSISLHDLFEAGSSLTVLLRSMQEQIDCPSLKMQRLEQIIVEHFKAVEANPLPSGQPAISRVMVFISLREGVAQTVSHLSKLPYVKPRFLIGQSSSGAKGRGSGGGGGGGVGMHQDEQKKVVADFRQGRLLPWTAHSSDRLTLSLLISGLAFSTPSWPHVSPKRVSTFPKSTSSSVSTRQPPPPATRRGWDAQAGSGTAASSTSSRGRRYCRIDPGRRSWQESTPTWLMLRRALTCAGPIVSSLMGCTLGLWCSSCPTLPQPPILPQCPTLPQLK